MRTKLLIALLIGTIAGMWLRDIRPADAQNADFWLIQIHSELINANMHLSAIAANTR